MAKFYQQLLAERHATLLAEQRLTAAQIEQLNKQIKQLDRLNDRLDHFKRVFGNIFIFRE